MRIAVVDDGHGFPFKGRLDDPALAARELGPAALRDRAALLGGVMSIDSSDSGTRLAGRDVGAVAMPVRVVLADDHPLVLKGLEALLGAERDFTVVAQCKDGEEASGLSAPTSPISWCSTCACPARMASPW